MAQLRGPLREDVDHGICVALRQALQALQRRLQPASYIQHQILRQPGILDATLISWLHSPSVAWEALRGGTERQPHLKVITPCFKLHDLSAAALQ